MAIAFDAAGPTNANSGSTTSLTFNHTVGTGSNRILLVGFLTNNATDVVSSVIWDNGGANTAMTRIRQQAHTDAGKYYCYVYGLIAPTSGTKQIAINFSSASVCYATSISYTGVDQIALPSNTTGGNAGTSTWTTTVNVGLANSWVVSATRSNDNFVTTAPAITRVSALASPARPQYTFSDSNGRLSIGNYTIAGTKQDSGVDSIIGLELNASGLENGLASYWKLDESSGNAADSVGSNTLTNNGTIPFVAGKVNNAADLELASAQYFSIADATQTGLDITGNISMAFWYKPESAPATNDANYFVAKRDGTAAAYWFKYEDVGGTKKLTAYYANGAADRESNYNTTLSNGTWYHLVVTIAPATKAFQFYINGSANNETSNNGGTATAIANVSAPFEFGRAYYGGAYADGVVDEIGIWSRVLTSTEVTSLYNSGAGLQYPFVSGPANVKTINGLATASVKTVSGVAIASVKSINGLT